MSRKTFLVISLFLLGMFCSVPHTASAAVTNFFGIELGKQAPKAQDNSQTEAHGQCDSSGCGFTVTVSKDGTVKGCTADFDMNLMGKEVFAPNLTGSWSDFATRAECLGGNKQNFGYLLLAISGKDIPAETDIRICVQAIDDRKTGDAKCTDWASKAGTAWNPTGWVYANPSSAKPDGFRIKIESKKLVGRSITDVRLQARVIRGGKASAYTITPWTSKGGGWDKSLLYAGTGADSNGIDIEMQIAKLANVPTPDLSVLPITTVSGTAITPGTPVAFKATVKNVGSDTTGKAFKNIFKYRWDDSSPWQTISENTMATLKKGASAVATSNQITFSRGGTLQVEVCADSGQVIDELHDETTDPDHNNNCTDATPPFSVGTPNLVAKSIDSGPIVTGKDAAFVGVVSNDGTDTSSPATARFCVLPSNSSVDCANSTTGSLGDIPVGALAANATVPVTALWHVSAGTYTAYLCVVGKNCVSFPIISDCFANNVDVADNDSQTFYNNSCTSSITSICAEGMLVPPVPASYNQIICTPPPILDTSDSIQDDITFSANTLLVRKGSQVSLTWSGGNAKSCKVTGTNGFSSTAVSGSNVLSGPIDQKALFTASCILGSDSKTRSLIVNIIPVIEEI